MSHSSRGRNGVLPINPTIMRKSAAGKADPKPSTKSPTPRLRLIIRRLPPGLTENEFWAYLGDEWRAGSAMVDWVGYQEGKVSKDPSKPSRPARAYIKVKEPAYLDQLSAKVKQTTFHDAKNTTKDSCLLGPPSLEFAPFQKVPGGRIRHDGRQGTIDQDQEFIDFLQSLTEPITRPAINGVEIGETRPGAVTTTPLVQYIKEKKAAKVKEAADAKRAKAKEAKAAKAEKKAAVIVKNASTSAADKERVAKATQETVKAINRSVAAMQNKSSTSKRESKSAAAKESPTSPQPVKRERERGSASVAAKILQRDLGLTPKEPRTRRQAATATATSVSEEKKPAKVDEPPATSLAVQADPPPSPAPAPPTGPKNTRPQSATPKQPVAQRASKPASQPSAGAKSAFLKHANPSQGVTEDLLRGAFEAFGTLTRCEIDRKKGFGYIDFTDPESLRKAMQASPVKVGNGQVVVLENKTRSQSSSKPGGPNSSAPASPAPTKSQPATSSSKAAVPPPAQVQDSDHTTITTAPADTLDTSAVTDQTSAPAGTGPPSIAPKGATQPASRGGNHQRGGRGGSGTFGAGRGNHPSGTRGGGSRGGGGSKGGRGGNIPFHPRGRGASNSSTASAGQSGANVGGDRAGNASSSASNNAPAATATGGE